MNRDSKQLILACTATIAGAAFPTVCSAAEFASFGSFYIESWAFGWLIAIVVALLTAALLFFSGGAASPIVASIGSTIGGWMGLSGIAATNAGLAFLGAGSIASGGFGIIGGRRVSR